MTLSLAAILLAAVACALAGASLYLDLHTRHHSREAHRRSGEVHELVQEVHQVLTGHEGDCPDGPVYVNPKYLRDPYDDDYPPIAREPVADSTLTPEEAAEVRRALGFDCDPNGGC